jgi:glutamate racemase
VQLIENGQIDSAEMNQLLHSYLEPMIAANIDYLVLGCSHYLILYHRIEKYSHIQIIDSGSGGGSSKTSKTYRKTASGISFFNTIQKKYCKKLWLTIGEILVSIIFFQTKYHLVITYIINLLAK